MVLPVSAVGKKPTRAERNHNPGNIRHAKGVRWQGTDCPQLDREFVTFEAPRWGFRALARCLITYFDKRFARDGSKIDCIADVIERWAPPEDKNDTQAYIKAVAKEMGVAPKAELDLYDFNTMKRLVRAIARHESGRFNWSEEELDAGLIAAGLQLPKSRMGLVTELSAVSVGSTGAIILAINEAADAARVAGARAHELADAAGILPEWVGPLVAIPAAIAVLVLCLRLAHRQRLLGA